MPDRAGSKGCSSHHADILFIQQAGGIGEIIQPGPPDIDHNKHPRRRIAQRQAWNIGQMLTDQIATGTVIGQHAGPI